MKKDGEIAEILFLNDLNPIHEILDCIYREVVWNLSSFSCIIAFILCLILYRCLSKIYLELMMNFAQLVRVQFLP